MTFESTDDSALKFIKKWKTSSGGELSESQSYLLELCDLIGVDHPFSQAEDPDETYKFERAVTFNHPDGSTSSGRVDLYKRGCFVLESKQGTERRTKKDSQNNLPKPASRTARKNRTGTAVRNTGNWDSTMVRARSQAENYAKALPTEEGWPPFLIVVDIGHDMHIYADFSQQGKNYVQFPDAQGFRIKIDDLIKAEIRDLLHGIWTDPLSLDPSTKSAAVTNEIADHLAALAKSLEADGHESEYVSAFLMRCIFTMFAEDVELIKKNSFTEMLSNLKGQAEKGFVPMLEALWKDMDKGTNYSVQLQDKVLRFNGYLFKENTAIKMNEGQLNLLIEAAEADWQYVEPAIFGTLLERALNPRERHKLGAHYTPRAYVERLIIPTVIEPLKEDWADIQTAAELLLDKGGDKNKEAAKKTVRDFHVQLCETKVLDPACGSANFLYVTMEHMKRLEGEVIEMMEALGDPTPAFTIDPHQFLGIELNPRAAKIAETVLWIGYLQWHFRTFGKTAPAEPVLKDFHNIECRDALLDWDSRELVRDAMGEPITIWDRRTTKTHPVTEKEVPDDSVREPIYKYINPRATNWPEATFIVGNPPYVASKDFRNDFGDGYSEAVWKSHKINESADFVMYWWDKAADKVANGNTKRFGFITTNSITQTFSRRTVEKYISAKKPISIIYAIPDHPWVDGQYTADVRVAMTTVEKGDCEGRLVKIQKTTLKDKTEVELNNPLVGKIWANLKIGANVTAATPLQANSSLASPGFKLHGSGFILYESKNPKLYHSNSVLIKDYMNGRDMVGKNRCAKLIDAFGLTEESFRLDHPDLFQHIYQTVKPERDQNRRETYRKNWWIFGEPRKEQRNAMGGLQRYIATVETAKHRIFLFLDKGIAPDNKLICFATEHASHLGVLSSHIHWVWAIANAGKIGMYDGDAVYPKGQCFDPFPFPESTPEKEVLIGSLAEELDGHRKARQNKHPHITLTDMYNVLRKINLR